MFSAKDLFFTRTSGYFVNNSLRFRSSASAYLSRTFATPTNNTVWSYSGWVKRGAMGGSFTLMGGSTYAMFGFRSTDEFMMWNNAGSSSATTTGLFRDPAAWYHICVISNGTTIIGYVNNKQAFTWTTTITNFNSAGTHYIGRDSSGDYFDGYLAEVNFIDGQALTPSSFGQTDATTGVWQPKAYTGTYGTNGFYLKFADASAATAAAIGKDSSGNGNNWTPSGGISVSAGVTYDAMVDSPTNSAAASNYCVLNAVETNYGSITNANLSASLAVTGTTGRQARGTFLFPSSGKYYFEVNPSTLGVVGQIGVAKFSSPTNGGIGLTPSYSLGDVYLYLSNGQKSDGSTGSAYGASYTTANTIGVAVDVTNGTLTFYKDNVSQGTAFSSLTLSNYFPVVYAGGASGTFACNVNFGQRPFTYTPPSGFVALNTQNLPTPTIAAGANYMAAVTYNGTSASNTVTATSSNSGNNPLAITFQPDLVWIKSRSAATNHELTDSVRGVTKSLNSNTTAAEATDTNGLTAFTSSGFTVGSDSNYNNGTGPATYVAWEWKAGGTSGTISPAGTIAATGSVNVSAGFSVVTFTANGTNGATIGHGLGVAPKMIIIKCRSNGSTDWVVYHSALGATQGIYLDLTNAAATSSLFFNNTAPTSSAFSIGTTGNINVNGYTNVAYCFTDVAGYSAFGQYTGNGSSDGPMVWTGFRPRFVLLKRTDTAGTDWIIYDSSRNTYNVTNAYLAANLSGAEGTYANDQVDFLSNGFKQRGTASGENASGGTYIYACFAENPFKYANAR